MKRAFRIARLILQGFTYKTAKLCIRFQEQYKYDRIGEYTVKELLSILPFGKFDKMFANLLSFKFLLSEYSEFLPDYYYIKLKRGRKNIFYPISSDVRKYDEADFTALIKEKKKIDIRKSEIDSTAKFYTCEYCDDMFMLNGIAIEQNQLAEKINALDEDYIIMEHIPEPFIEVDVINRKGSNPVILENNYKYDDAVIKLVTDISMSFPEVEYLHFTIATRNNGKPLIAKIETGVNLVRNTEFNEQLRQFISEKLSLAKSQKVNTWNTVKRYAFSYYAGKKGFVDFMYKNWLRGKKEDKKTSTLTKRQMWWAHRRGFYSYRIFQYGLTEENYKEFLSDYDYKRLRPINNKYREWLSDKLSVYYAMKLYNKYMPEYYYHICPRDNGMLYLKMDKCPGGLPDSVEGILSLLSMKNKLAMKPVVASHGEGFYKLYAIDEQFFLNDAEISRKDMREFLENIDTDYLITEYTEMHKDLRRICPFAACTVRIMVINRDFYNPVIEDAYFRIATSSTGVTDNLAAGGVFAHVNGSTGELEEAYSIKEHVISPCPLHPDTGVEIRGELPHWEEVCRKVIEISKYIAPIEYMGFDVVITEDGFKILEINTHQDLHRYPEYSDSIKNYFNTKFEQERLKS